ncbi:MAG TPA: hypothetical protein VFW60_05900 [Rhodanobacteraceae bacterium]|nr:hypothetical protein [Rhodanobacteraceae bacterium]
MSAETEAPDVADETGTDDKAAAAQISAALAAGIGLFASSRRILAALLALFTAEARLLGASFAPVFLACVALVAFAVALWVCVVALIGWALAVATHSVGIALAILVVIHLGLVTGLWFSIRRAIFQITFPRTRAELSAVRRGVRRDVAKFKGAAASTASPKRDTST